MTREDYIKNYTKEVETEIDGEKTTIIVSRPHRRYITHKSLLKDESLIDILAEHEITIVDSTFGSDNNDYHVANIGYSGKENRWFGWSHRAMCSFTIGSKVKKGDCAYSAANKEDFEQYGVDFWTDDCSENVHIENRTEKGFDVVWTISQNVPNKKARGGGGSFHYKYPKEYGRGEWTAKTLEDAKQMAIDYAKRVA